MPLRPHFPHPRPRFRPRGGVYGGWYPGYAEPYVIEVEREPALPWRVTNTTSWGTNVVFQSASMQAALDAYKRYNPQGFNNGVHLERWTGGGWQMEASKSVTNGRAYNDRSYGLGSLEDTMLTAQQISDRWDALIAKVKAVAASTGPGAPAALQDIYKAYATFSVALSAGVVDKNIAQFEKQLTAAETTFNQLYSQPTEPAKLNLWPWALGAVALLGFMYWDSKRHAYR